MSAAATLQAEDSNMGHLALVEAVTEALRWSAVSYQRNGASGEPVYEALWEQPSGAYVARQFSREDLDRLDPRLCVIMDYYETRAAHEQLARVVRACMECWNGHPVLLPASDDFSAFTVKAFTAVSQLVLEGEPFIEVNMRTYSFSRIKPHIDVVVGSTHNTAYYTHAYIDQHFPQWHQRLLAASALHLEGDQVGQYIFGSATPSNAITPHFPSELMQAPHG